MFTNITWANYFIVIILLTTVYYVFIGIRFYQEDIKTLLKRLRFSLNTVRNTPRVFESSPDAENNEAIEKTLFEKEEDPFHDVEDLVSRLKDAIKVASNRKALKEEFLQYLRLIIKEYPDLKTSPFQSAINELIASECSKYGSIILSEEDAVKLWVEV